MAASPRLILSTLFILVILLLLYFSFFRVNIQSLPPHLRKNPYNLTSCQISSLKAPTNAAYANSSMNRFKIFTRNPKENKPSATFYDQDPKYFEYVLQEDILKTIGRAQPHKRPRIFLELGAFIGIHSLAIAAAGHPVHAFEPDPDDCNLLACSSVLNQFKNLNVHLVGFSDRNSFWCYDPQMVMWVGGKRTVKKKTAATCRSLVPVRIIDEFWEQELENDRPFAVKIKPDKGLLQKLLDGAKTFLRESPPPYLYVVLNSRLDFASMDMISERYSTVHLINATGELWPISRPLSESLKGLEPPVYVKFEHSSLRSEFE